MIVTLGVRVLQLLFGAVVVALSAVLINGYGPGHAPSLIDYGAFCGAAGMIFAAVGVVACFVESLQGIVMLALDGLATFFVLAGGIAYAATMKVGSCTNLTYLYDHQKTIDPSQDKFYSGNTNQAEKKALDDLEGRCRELQATTAFLWFLFACFAVTVGLSFVSKGKGRGSLV